MPSMPLMASLAAAVDAGPDEEVAGPAAGAASRAAGEGSAAGLRASVTVRRSAATRAVSSGALWLQKPNTRAPGKPCDHTAKARKEFSCLVAACRYGRGGWEGLQAAGRAGLAPTN